MIFATIAARVATPAFAYILRKWVLTVYRLISNTAAIALSGSPFATIRAISRSRGLSVTECSAQEVRVS